MVASIAHNCCLVYHFEPQSVALDIPPYFMFLFTWLSMVTMQCYLETLVYITWNSILQTPFSDLGINIWTISTRHFQKSTNKLKLRLNYSPVYLACPSDTHNYVYINISLNLLLWVLPCNSSFFIYVQYF